MWNVAHEPRCYFYSPRNVWLQTKWMTPHAPVAALQCTVWIIPLLAFRFCLSETSCPQEDHFPPNLCVKVNGKPCNLPVSPPRLLLVSHFKLPVALHTESCQETKSHILGFVLFVCFVLFWLQGYLPPTKNGVEPKRPSRPINITSLIRLSTTVPNTIVVSWTSEIGRVRRVVERMNESDLCVHLVDIDDQEKSAWQQSLFCQAC